MGRSAGPAVPEKAAAMKVYAVHGHRWRQAPGGLRSAQNGPGEDDSTAAKACPRKPWEQFHTGRLCEIGWRFSRMREGLLDHPVGAGKECRWYGEVQRVSRFRVDDQLITGRLLDR